MSFVAAKEAVPAKEAAGPQKGIAQKPMYASQTAKPKLAGSVSISNIFDVSRMPDKSAQSESEKSGESKGPRASYSTEEFNNAWRAFAQQLKAADAQSIYNTLVAEMPKVSVDDLITLKINNSVQEIEVEHLKMDLLDFLRKRLNNYGLQLQTQLVKDDMTKVSMYTDRDKYNAMAQKNAALEKLREKLNLDLTF